MKLKSVLAKYPLANLHQDRDATKRYLGSIKAHLGLIKKIKLVFGVLIVIFGFLILFELDRHLEASLTDMLPEVWVNFITKF